MNIFAITRKPALASAMCQAPLSLDCCDALPPSDLLGQMVMIETMGRLLGCARFTGIVTLHGESVREFEHRSAEQIRSSAGRMASPFWSRLWVFEDGMTFERAVEIDAGKSGAAWRVPDGLRAELETARRIARYAVV